MIIAMPATAVNTAADCATPMGRIDCTACRRLRSGGDDGDDDVDESVEEEQSAGPAADRALSSLLAQPFDRHGEGIARRPRPDVVVAPRGCRLHVRRRHEPFEQSPARPVVTLRRRDGPARYSPPRSRRRRAGRQNVKTGGRPKRPRRSTTTVRDGPGAAHTPRSRKARAGRGAPPMTAPAPLVPRFRRANSKESTSSTNVNDSGSLSSGAERRASRSNRRRTMSPAQRPRRTFDAAEYQEIDEEVVQKSGVGRVDVEW